VQRQASGQLRTLYVRGEVVLHAHTIVRVYSVCVRKFIPIPPQDQFSLSFKDILTVHKECKWIISYYIKQSVPLSLPEITRITPESLQKPRNSNEISVYNWTCINFAFLQETFIALEFFIKQITTAIADKSMLCPAAEFNA
jgi:hypothetical protein